MSDRDTETGTVSEPGRAPPSVAFNQAMVAVAQRRKDLAEAIRNHDFEAVEYTARSATNLWLAGRVACRRLLQRSLVASLYHDSTRKLLEENYMALLDLFAEATATIEVPGMIKVLRELRGTLTDAMARPLV